MTMAWLTPLTLTGSHATLVPLSHSHHDDLAQSVKDGELWKLWYTTVPAPEGMHAEIARRLDLQSQGSMLPFAVIDNSTGKAAGMTTHMNVDSANRRVETFLQPARPPRNRAAWREARWRAAQSPDRERHAARQLRLQHHRDRVAHGEIASALAASRQ
jgi:hypothetical protein